MAKTVDLRTYLLLERAFVRRLQRSWRMLSAPIYQKITQACLDHKWDEARRLVPELDMAEVGTQNREWITYMLLSCAVFGAGMVRKSKPSFVGVGSFDTFLKQVTNNFLMYLEFNATAQVQAEALQSIAEDEAKTKAQALKSEGIGGVTRKFDEAKHPRDKDGRFAEATTPRIFNRPSDVKSYESFGGGTRWGWLDPKTGETTGMLLTGEPIPREGIPPKLYHVTTNAPAVESSGVLLGQRGDTGLGGGQAEGVSFTSSPEDAVVIQRELRRAIRVARGEDRIEDLDRYAREDEQEVGLPPHTLDDAVQFAKDQWVPNQQGIEHTFVWDKDLPEDKRGYVGPPPPPEEQERLRRSSMNDALKAYLQIRGKHDVQYPLLKNPILFGRQEHLAKLNPEHVQILETAAEDIPAEALVSTGSDKFLHEVRVYADVPRRRNVVKWDESQHPRDKDGQFTEGVGHGEKTAQLDTGTGGGGGVAISPPAAKAKGGGRPEAVSEVQVVADAYNAKYGMPPVQHGYAKLDEARAGIIADAYDALPLDDRDNPEVRIAYEALATEIRQQFDHIVKSGVTFTPWTKEGQPYPDSKTMVDDIRQNKHMYFYTGGDPNPFMAARDPETGLTVNDMFRAVHDYFGHAAGGYGFGPRGEENAWMSHSQMLTPQARRALTTETRGQNSWVNFGRHNYDAEGNHKNIPPQDRPFATQKTALLPEWYALLPGESTLKWDESQHPRDEDGQFTRVAMTSQRPAGDPGHQPNKEVFSHMREFHERLEALPGVSRVSVKPGVGGWEGGSESMWQIYYRGNGEARKLVARTAKAFNQDAVLILNKCEKGQNCQPAVELSFQGGVSPTAREAVHEQLVAHGIGGWTWMKRNGKTILRMVCVPQWGGEAVKHQQATAAVSQRLQKDGLKNHRRVRKVAVSVMEREGAQSYDQVIAGH